MVTVGLLPPAMVPSGETFAPANPPSSNVPAFSTAPPVKALLFVSASVPSPVFVMLDPAPLITPPSVATICGASTFTVVTPPFSVVVPLSERLKMPLKFRSFTPAFIWNALFTENAADAARLVPLAMLICPVPSGPAVTGFATLPVKVEGVLLAPSMMPPEFRFTGFEKVLAPLSCSSPVPALLIPDGDAPSVMMDEMFSEGVMEV